MLQGYAAVGIKAPGLRRFEAFFFGIMLMLKLSYE